MSLCECRACGAGTWTADARGVVCAECAAPLPGGPLPAPRPPRTVGTWPHASAAPSEAERAAHPAPALLPRGLPLSAETFCYLTWGRA